MVLVYPPVPCRVKNSLCLTFFDRHANGEQVHLVREDRTLAGP